MDTNPFAIALRKDTRIAPAKVGADTTGDEIPIQITGQEGHIALYVYFGMLPM